MSIYVLKSESIREQAIEDLDNTIRSNIDGVETITKSDNILEIEFSDSQANDTRTTALQNLFPDAEISIEDRTFKEVVE